MILTFEYQTAAPQAPRGESAERHAALVRCLKRMGFFDPEALIASAAAQEAEAMLRRNPPPAAAPVVSITAAAASTARAA